MPGVHRRQTLDSQPRSSQDTCINSIFSLYGASSPSAEADRGRQSGDRRASCAQTVTLLPSSVRHRRSCEHSDLAYYARASITTPPLPITVAMVGDEDSPRVSLATTSSTHEQSSYATPPSTRSYFELFEDSRGARIHGLNFRSSDMSSSSNTTPAITFSREFRSTSPQSKCSSKGSSMYQQQRSLIDLPPLPPSRQTTPSPSNRPCPSTSSSLLTPQRSLKHLSGKPLPPGPTHSPSSKVSLVPSEGEDSDAFHVRNTYAQLEAVGVKGDGYEEGIERTRARIGTSRQSQLQADAALADGTDKKKDLDLQEIHALKNVDR